MEFQKILLERNIADIIVNIILVWFGLYICPAKPKPIYIGLGKREGEAGEMGSRGVREMLTPFLF